MKIGIIDADLLGRNKHRFPNLVCEKLSGYWKSQGAKVQLLEDYDWPTDLDHIYIAKVFTDTPVPPIVDMIAQNPKLYPKVHVGGTGFYFDKAPNLPYEIEHHMPDYHLYDEWIDKQVEKAENEAQKNGREFKKSRFMLQFKEYTDYSIGFVTRGCFRHCKFCVNQKYDRVFVHSPLDEFYDPTRKKICLLDDNFLGCPNWKDILLELIDTGKPFKFKQGLDERLLNEEKCELLFGANYDGDFTFAFDNYSDYDLIQKKLELISKYKIKQNVKFYVLVGFEGTDIVDIEHAFERVELLFKYGCLPYIMRYQNKNESPWKKSRYKGVYITLARWCNQPSFVKKMSFSEFCHANQRNHKNQEKLCSSMRALELLIKEKPEWKETYFDMKFGENITKRQ